VGIESDDASGLRAVPSPEDTIESHSWFCGYCGRGGPSVESPGPIDRLCSACGFGLVLETVSELAPSPADAFLVVDEHLSVQAISHQAEELLGVSERFVVRRPLTDLLMPADADPQAATKLVAAVAEASSGVAGARPSHLLLRPVNAPGMRLRARIGRCGPPLAALIVLEPTETDRLRLVLRH
jgi:hypothetical protein